MRFMVSAVTLLIPKRLNPGSACSVAPLLFSPANHNDMPLFDAKEVGRHCIIEPSDCLFRGDAQEPRHVVGPEVADRDTPLAVVGGVEIDGPAEDSSAEESGFHALGA